MSGQKTSELESVASAARIGVGQRLPTVTVSLVGGGEMILPDNLADGWAVLLLYRGHWCPYCRTQLRDFQQNLGTFEEAGIQIVAMSADPLSEARATVEAHGIEYPVGYGLDPSRIREILGAYVSEDGRFLQATGFILRPHGVVELVVYSSGAVGRLNASDVRGLITYARRNDSN